MRTLIILPAFNEEHALPGTIAELQSLPDGYELLVVNDGSRDGTGAVAEGLARTTRVPMHVVHLALNCGIGVAVQTGYLFAAKRGGYEYVIQFDADGQHDPAAVPALVAACERERLDLCVGSRFLTPASDGFRSTAVRRVGIHFFARLIGLLTRVAVTDPTSGLRCAGRRVWERFARHYPEDYPEPESLFWCARNGLRIGEIPVRMRERAGGVSSIRRGREVYYMVKVTVAILLDRLRGSEV
jgi:glycosyltransferase involved in cell wall biosynthesis